MSLTPLFADGFEQYVAAGTAASGGVAPILFDINVNLSIGTNFGRFGGIGAQHGNNPLSRSFTSVAVGGVGFGVQPPSAATSMIFFYDSAGTVQGVVGRNSDGSVSVWRGNFTTLLGTSAAAVLSATALHHVEAQYKPDPSAGTADVWVDGVNVLAITGANTRGSGVSGSGVGRIGFTFTGGSASIDDVFMYDATSRTGTSGSWEHYGDRRVQTLFPSGAGTGDVGTWTQVGGTGGSPYTAINERPNNGDTSYLADATAGDIKSVALDDLVAGTTGVTAVFPTIVFKKDDATSRTVATGLRTSSTNAFGAAVGSPGTYDVLQQVFTTDGSGSALTPPGVNGSELLVKVVT